MNTNKKNVLYYQAKMRCKALMSYGKSNEYIIEELRNSFWPKNVADQLISELEELRNKKINFKSDVQLPRRS